MAGHGTRVTFAIVDQAAYDVGRLAHRLGTGYYAHAAALAVASDPRARELIPAQRTAISDSLVFRKDGSHHIFDFAHYLAEVRDNPDTASELARVWLMGALLTLGEALRKHRYFDKAPELELVRHLRNGIAHGNAFWIKEPSVLMKRPAHNRLAAVRGPNRPVFEITPSVQNQTVLFDFMGAADVLDLLFSVEMYLLGKGTGQPIR
jgi:hypothetical protein